jgi:hypothetical protein
MLQLSDLWPTTGARKQCVVKHHMGERSYFAIRRQVDSNIGLLLPLPAVLAFGFKELELNRIYAHHMQRNPASGRVMEKLGMRYEGLMRQHFKKWDQYEDMLAYGLLREEFDALGQ